MSTHTCPGPKCDTIVDDSLLACSKHWGRLPYKLRSQITKAAEAKRREMPGAAGTHLSLVREAMAYWAAQ